MEGDNEHLDKERTGNGGELSISARRELAVEARWLAFEQGEYNQWGAY
jgi:hypothetical protein